MTSKTSQRGEHESSGAAEQRRSSGGTGQGRGRRAATAVAGGGLLLYGLLRRSVRGAAAAVAGGWLLSRALRGRGRRGWSEGPGGQSGGTRRASAGGSEQRERGAPRDAPDVQRSITIERPAEEVYDRWRDPETHEAVWAEFADVNQLGEDRQHWRIPGPAGVTVEWEAKVTAAEPGEFLRWKSLPGATVPNQGSVRFAERAGGEETEVTLHLRFDPPGGRVGSAAMDRLDVVPDTAAGTALGRFKSLVETGEIPTLERNPSGRGSGDLV